MTQPEPPPKPGPQSKQPRDTGDAQDAPRVIPAEDLFASRREVLIQFGDQQYRLRITAANKLILTK